MADPWIHGPVNPVAYTHKPAFSGSDVGYVPPGAFFVAHLFETLASLCGAGIYCLEDGIQVLYLEPAAAAAASAKLFGLSADEIEDALGIACTQVCGLMSAQHGSMIQHQHSGVLGDPEQVDEIVVEMSEPAFKKGGWAPKRPAEFTSAQMSAPYAAACQIVDKAVLVEQFTPTALDRDEIWTWVSKIRCVHNPDFDKDKKTAWFQRMRVVFKDKSKEDMEVLVEGPKGVKPLLTNADIREKWILLTQDVIDIETWDKIERIVLSLGGGADLTELLELLG
ncbi:hypothetical protein F5B18DRAFT_653089 [Nemania serpens]|nr:hypothetical protein F5B18DRAFT_653089 [Nemania serpens]